MHGTSFDRRYGLLGNVYGIVYDLQSRKRALLFLTSSTSTTGSVMTLRIQIETSRFYIDIGGRSSGSTNSTRSIMVRTNIISSWIRQ